MTQQGKITLKIRNGVAYLTFFHPASNSFTGVMLAELTDKIYELNANSQVKIIVLQSEGRTFCAGASFDELIALKDMLSAQEFFMGFARVINAMRKINKLIIAKVQGKAVGGGVGLIAAADYVFATDLAAVKLSELSIGIGPYVIAPAVKRKIGMAAFSELSVNTTKWHNAYWAREKGLFAQVFERIEKLNEETEILAEKLASFDAQAMKLLKREIWKNTDNWDELLEKQAEISAHLVLQDFAKEKLNKK